MKEEKKYNLSRLMGDGEELNVNGKNYKVYPLTIAHTQAFLESNIRIDAPFINLTTADNEISKWFGEVEVKYGNDIYKSRFITYADGSEVEWSDIVRNGWNIDDLKKFFKLLVALSD